MEGRCEHHTEKISIDSNCIFAKKCSTVVIESVSFLIINSVFGFDLSHGCSEYSTQLNAARIKVLRAQDGVVGEMKEDAGKSLLRVTKDATAYRKSSRASSCR